jgi:hypothetical protein
VVAEGLFYKNFQRVTYLIILGHMVDWHVIYQVKAYSNERQTVYETPPDSRLIYFSDKNK